MGGKEVHATRRDWASSWSEVVWSWLLNVSGKDGGKLIFTSGKIGICEVQRVEKCMSVLE